MQEGRGWHLGHSEVTVRRSGRNTLEQRQDASNSLNAIESSHEMYL
jgi:hypothetical protein